MPVKWALAFDERCLLHAPPRGSWHPENPERLRIVYEAVSSLPIAKEAMVITDERATEEDVALVHEPRYIERVKEACRTSPQGAFLDADTYVGGDSFEAALVAAGLCMACVDAILEGEVKRAFALVRPPGHHATPNAAMGFCLFNNAAIAAAHARRRGAERVFIADFDVHHGNGTQDAFYADPNVFYFSTHQYPWYPGTGLATETGEGEGEGTTFNVPLPPGCTDSEYGRIYREVCAPLIRWFRPDLLVISAGFDPHHRDPLSGMHLTAKGFRAIVEAMLEAGEEVCQGRALVVFEGGYDPEGLRRSAANVALALAESEERVEDETVNLVAPQRCYRAVEGAVERARELMR